MRSGAMTGAVFSAEAVLVFKNISSSFRRFLPDEALIVASRRSCEVGVDSATCSGGLSENSLELPGPYRCRLVSSSRGEERKA